MLLKTREHLYIMCLTDWMLTMSMSPSLWLQTPPLKSVDWGWTNASVWQTIDLPGCVFARLSARMPSVRLSFTGGDWGGGWGRGVQVLCMVWRGGPCLLCCLHSHFMAPSVHKQTIKRFLALGFRFLYGRPALGRCVSDGIVWLTLLLTPCFPVSKRINTS